MKSIWNQLIEMISYSINSRLHWWPDKNRYILAGKFSIICHIHQILHLQFENTLNGKKNQEKWHLKSLFTEKDKKLLKLKDGRKQLDQNDILFNKVNIENKIKICN